jgi:hypothetical protein
MNDDYLWDRSGEPDPEVEALERRLSVLAQGSPPALALPERSAGSGGPEGLYYVSPDVRSRPGIRAALAAAATLAVVASGVFMVYRSRGQASGWEVASTAGAPTIASQAVGERGRLPVGGWLETDERSTASLTVGTIGRVTVEPGTRVRLISARSGDHRLQLERGTLRATIWAPPGQFAVETASSTAVDLGCAYTLTMDDEGAGLVTVLVGWVGFEWRGRESFVPAGSLCPTRPGKGPGTPYNERVSPAFRDALQTIDFTGGAPEASAALTRVLDEAQERDEVTLWHLLTRVSTSDRDRVFDRLAQFVPPPAGVTREGVRTGRREMLDAWWDALGLGTAAWWRTWKR